MNVATLLELCETFEKLAQNQLQPLKVPQAILRYFSGTLERGYKALYAQTWEELSKYVDVNVYNKLPIFDKNTFEHKVSFMHEEHKTLFEALKRDYDALLQVYKKVSGGERPTHLEIEQAKKMDPYGYGWGVLKDGIGIMNTLPGLLDAIKNQNFYLWTGKPGTL